MASRNVWLSFSEWELITGEHPRAFKLNKDEIKQWKEQIELLSIQGYGTEHPQCFKRIYVDCVVEGLKSQRAKNILYRENWRSQDISRLMLSSMGPFIGFVLNFADNPNIDTTFEQWKEQRNEMKTKMEESDKRIWFHDDLLKLYNSLH